MKRYRLWAVCLALLFCFSVMSGGCGGKKSDDKKTSAEGKSGKENDAEELKEGDLGTGEEVLVLEDKASDAVSSDIEELEKEKIVEGSVMDDDVQFIEDEEYEKQNSGKGR